MSTSTNSGEVAAEMARSRLERKRNEIHKLQSELQLMRTVIQRARDRMNVQEEEYRAIGLRFHQAVSLTSRESAMEDGELPELEAFKASPSPAFISSTYYFPAYWEKMLDLTQKAYDASRALAPLPPLEEMRAKYETVRPLMDEIIELSSEMTSKISDLQEGVEDLIDQEDPDDFWFTHDMEAARAIYLGQLGSPAQRTQMLMDLQSEPEWEHFEEWVGTWPEVRRLVQSGVPLTVAAEKIFFEVQD